MILYAERRGNTFMQQSMKRTGRKCAQVMPYLLLSPSIILIMMFKFYPIVNTALLSFRNLSLLKRKSGIFVGLDNYRRLLFSDAIFNKAFINSITWVMSNVLIQAILGLFLAILLNRKFRGRGIYRAVVFAPWAVSGILVSLIFGFMLNESVGVINDIMIRLGIIGKRISWFATSYTAMASVIIASIWRGLPFFVISIMASLQTISEDVYESGKIDGANAWKSFFYITLPMIRDPLILTTLLRAIWTLNSADLIFSMTGGGPNYGTTTIPVYIITTFRNSLDFSYTSTISIIMCLFMVIVSLVYLKIARYGKESLY